MTIFEPVRRIIYFIELLLLALLIVPTVHAQTTSDQILVAVEGENSDHTIYTINVDDAVKTQIGIVRGDDHDAGWSPDGKYIYLFDNNDSNLPALTLIDTDTNHSQPIPDQIQSVFCGLPFSWSPKGEWLIYNTQSDSQPIRKIYNPTTDESQILTNANVDDLIMHWSSDNRYLTYQTQNNKLAIWDIQNQRMVAVPGAISDYFPKWSPIENLIAFSDESSTNHVIIYNLSSETRQQYDADSIGDWSPDGKFLTLSRRDKDQNMLVSILDVRTKELVELDRSFTTIGDEGQTLWSSDGRYLALSKQNATDAGRTLYILDVLNNSIQSAAISVGDFDDFLWSPVGNHLVVVADIETIEQMPYFTSVWLFDADSGQSQHYDVKILTMGYVRPIDWSPNGRYLIFENDNDLTLVDSASGKMEMIGNDTRRFGAAGWSPDGSRLVLVRGGEMARDIYVFTPEDYIFKNVTNTPDEDEIFLGWTGSQHNAYHIGFCGET